MRHWLADISRELNHASCGLGGCANTRKKKSKYRSRPAHLIVKQDD